MPTDRTFLFGDVSETKNIFVGLNNVIGISIVN